MTSMQRSRARRWGAVILAATALTGAAGCKGLLDVDNPNNALEATLNTPSSAKGLVSGTLATLVRATNAMYSPYATVTDELDWTGSRDGFNQLDQGFIRDPNNEFMERAYTFMAEARWMGDMSIGRLEPWVEDGSVDGALLADAYLYTALDYITIADMFRDWAFSDKREPAAPVGPANMKTVYDKAVTYLDKALALSPGDERILAVRARAKFARAVWTAINGATASQLAPANARSAPLIVSDAGAAADAQAALTAVGNDVNWEYRLINNSQLDIGDLAVGRLVNRRREIRIGTVYASDRVNASVTDPIDVTKVAPKLARDITDFLAADIVPNIIAVSARELRLIIAENALKAASGVADATFLTNINAIRTADGLTAYAGGTPQQNYDMLHYMRMTNLWMQGKRLDDMYRFGRTDTKWNPARSALKCPGAHFVLPLVEMQSNPLVPAQTDC